MCYCQFVVPCTVSVFALVSISELKISVLYIHSGEHYFVLLSYSVP